MPNEILFTGLDGSNPLAFLAAAGTLRIFDLSYPECRPRLGWRCRYTWHPFLAYEGEPMSEDDFIARLARPLGIKPPSQAKATRPNQGDSETLAEEARIQQAIFPDEEVAPAAETGTALKTSRSKKAKSKPADGSGEVKNGRSLTYTAERYRIFANKAAMQATPGNRIGADFAATWACDGIENEKGVVQKTRWDFTSGNQGFVDMARQLIALTSMEDLQMALFRPWAYDSPKPCLRWDPLGEARQYALQPYDPTNDKENPIRTMRGADRLAIEGLPLFPAVPGGSRGLETTGFIRSDGGWALVWPIWEPPVGLPVIRSLLAARVVCSLPLDRDTLDAMGIKELYISRVVRLAERNKTCQYRNFSPAMAL